MAKFHNTARHTLLIAATFSASAALPAHAQQPAPMKNMPGNSGTPSMPGMAMPGKGIADDASPSSKAFKTANDKMMKDMGAPMTGDADRDFVANMIPHHSGAIDMAKIELQYGKDPMLRALAKDIIGAQEKEIAKMSAWNKAHPAKP